MKTIPRRNLHLLIDRAKSVLTRSAGAKEYDKEYSEDHHQPHNHGSIGSADLHTRVSILQVHDHTKLNLRWVGGVVGHSEVIGLK